MLTRRAAFFAALLVASAVCILSQGQGTMMMEPSDRAIMEPINVTSNRRSLLEATDFLASRKSIMPLRSSLTAGLLRGGGRRARAARWWEPADFNTDAVFFFAHIPTTGGTVVSWHLRAIFPKGGVVPGSENSGAFDPGGFEHENPEAFPDWTGETAAAVRKRWTDGAQKKADFSTYKAAFGHNDINDPSVALFDGPLQFGTMLRHPRYFALFNAPKCVCTALAKRYTPWWKASLEVDPSVWKRSTSDMETGRPRAPKEVSMFCVDDKHFLAGCEDPFLEFDSIKRVQTSSR